MADGRVVYRYAVPVDDGWHRHDLSGAVLHVAARDPAVVEFWALHTGGPAVARSFRVYGTGHPMGDGCRHVGSVVCAGGVLVWHLFEQWPPAGALA